MISHVNASYESQIFGIGFSPVGQEGLFWIRITSECHSCSVGCKKLLAAELQKTEQLKLRHKMLSDILGLSGYLIWLQESIECRKDQL